MKSALIRQKFLDFFESKGHKIVPSSPMVIKDDPTLMFTNAGMNPFKDVFLGDADAVAPRVADSQKCLRVSGKHNDLEEVGVDTYHHTMFEMLGNWSFGDYFKKEAIEWAWELLTEVYQIPKDRLYVTIFEGDKEDNLELDEEAKGIWENLIDPKRIIPASKKDNFWEMGDTGPCGPCSEIHVDIRIDEERAKQDGKELVNEDHPEVIEIWNLVFMEMMRKSDRSLEMLPAKHIDTGMGFERLAMALQGVRSNYDTDIFAPTIAAIERATDQKYGRTDSKADVAFRVVADHVRAVAFSIADGQLPSNTGAGYVIRRILRRAIRYSYSFLDMKTPFIYQLTDVLKQEMGAFFPELKTQRELIYKVIREEEESFLRTLQKGIERLDQLIANTKGNSLEGKAVFELYDTYGFPADLTSLIASEHNKTIDEVAFEKELSAQKERSRADAKMTAGDWQIVQEGSEGAFVGYDHLEAKIKIMRYRAVESKGKTNFQAVFDQTPFYPMGGGQVGDKGQIESEEGAFHVLDTRKENNLIIHTLNKLPEGLGAGFHGKVTSQRRKHTEANHSATHLVHQALREVLGKHVEQKGSLVNAEYLRFDFSHFSKVEDDQIREVERLVNERIRENWPLEEMRSIPLDEAKDIGAMMLFGEKYGDEVRAIKFGQSIELCGGTHVERTGDIGLFRITNETAVAAGIRRIEALTSAEALKYVNEELHKLKDVRELFKGTKNLTKAIGDLMDANQALQKEVDKAKKAQAGQLKDELLQDIAEINGIRTIIKKVPLDGGAMKDIAFGLKSKEDNMVMVLASAEGGKALISCMVTEDLTRSKGLKAGDIIKQVAQHIKGGGGGQPFYATAGGKDPEGIERALEAAKELLAKA